MNYLFVCLVLGLYHTFSFFLLPINRFRLGPWCNDSLGISPLLYIPHPSLETGWQVPEQQLRDSTANFGGEMRGD
ncbi:hypothetical protein B0J18DRAFT_428815 [Chaetomium sp. MPI-SDFR-AT-0129]|nr:hypothetical protein B0J18DRAFT_428815 [Chaetomium sp. MPI-SDFR-AT-0129]